MKESTSKEQILKAIRDAQTEAERQQKVIDVDQQTPLFSPMEHPPVTNFEESLNAFNNAAYGGENSFIRCKNEHDAMIKLRSFLGKMQDSPIYTNEPGIEHFLTEGGIDFLNYEQGIKKARIVITFCECLVARFGTIVMSSRQKTGRKGHTLPDVHIVFAYQRQLLKEISDVFPFLQRKYPKNMPSMITFITGPSRTDAFEGEFVYGMSGSVRLFVFYIEI